MNHFSEAAVTVISLIIGIAALSVILSPKAKTTSVIQASASGLVNTLATAMSPVTGENVNIVSAYPGDTSSSNGSGLPSLNLGGLFSGSTGFNG